MKKKILLIISLLFFGITSTNATWTIDGGEIYTNSGIVDSCSNAPLQIGNTGLLATTNFLTSQDSAGMDFMCGSNIIIAVTPNVDYVGGVTVIGEGQYSSFIDLANSPIGYLIMFLLGLALLKYIAKELKGFTPNAGKGK